MLVSKDNKCAFTSVVLYLLDMDTEVDDTKYGISFDENQLPILHAHVKSSLKDANDNVQEYENNTYIDWQHECARLRGGKVNIYSKWTTIALLSIILGYVSGFIDLVSVWLNDFKKGLCLGKVDKWSLASPYLTCPKDQWHNWSLIVTGSDGFVSSMFVNLPIFLLLSLGFTVVAVYITRKDVDSIRLSGIPEIRLIIEGLNYRLSTYLSFRTLVYKGIGLIFMVSSGLWLGKEGPMVHISCCVINTFYNITVLKENQNEAVRRELLSAGFASGIAVAFKAPIGAVLFVIEIISSYFTATRIMWNSFVSATIAVVVLVGLKAFTEGTNFEEKDLFSVEFGNFSWLFAEMIPFVFLGFLGGIFGYLFIKVNSLLFSLNLRKRFEHLVPRLRFIELDAEFMELLAIAAITALINFPFEMTRLPLEDYVKLLFTECIDKGENEDANSTNFLCLLPDITNVFKLSYILLLGFLVCVYVYGTNIPGGILTPSLVLGATCGRIIGIICQNLQRKFALKTLEQCTHNSCLVSASSYAVIGAASFFTGITKLTMSVVVIMFELTGALSYVLPIMVSVMTLKFVNDYMSETNIYDYWIKDYFNAVNHNRDIINEGKGSGRCNFKNQASQVKNLLPDIPISYAMIPLEKIKCLYMIPDTPYTTSYLLNFLESDNHEGYPVNLLPSNPINFGYIKKDYLKSILYSYDYNDNKSILVIRSKDLNEEELIQVNRFEDSFPNNDITSLNVDIEREGSIIFDNMPLVLVIDMFEKLHLNYIIIKKYSTTGDLQMCGYVDRFKISKMIDLKFSSLNDETFRQEEYLQFEIDDEMTFPRRDRSSIELVS